MKAKIFSNDFNRIVAATKGFVSKDEARGLYRFIRLEFCAADSSVTAVAVDGYRLSVEHAVCECDEDFVAYINASTHLPRGEEAAIENTGNETLIRCGDFIFGCSYITPGEFLDWKNSLPKGDPTLRIGVNGNYLLSALQAAKVSCGNCFAKPVVQGIDPAVRGQWIMRGGRFCCSACSARAKWDCKGGIGGWSREYTQSKTPYCPNCGAKMNKEDADGN